MSFDVLQDKIRAMKNPTVAGLDARIEYVPEHIRQAAFAEHGAGLEGACRGHLSVQRGADRRPVRHRPRSEAPVRLL